jgi:hypothetical protein
MFGSDWPKYALMMYMGLKNDKAIRSHVNRKAQLR